MNEELVEYLGSGPCLALVGSGPSADCGLPTWRQLADKILERINTLNLSDKETAPIDEAHAQSNFPLMFERVERSKHLGKAFLYDTCRYLLKTPETPGGVYEALVRLPFQAFFTTNFDDLLGRHLERARVAPIIVKNTQSDLAKIDVDALRGYVVKLHGDFEADSLLILTESQYDALCDDPNFEYLRRFIQSYFLSRHLVMVGYSVSDPDIQRF